MWSTGFLVGLFAGIFLGVVFACWIVGASRADDVLEKHAKDVLEKHAKNVEE